MESVSARYPQFDQDVAPLADLLTRARSGDLQAYDGVVRHEHARLRGFLGLLGTPVSWLDDLEQEVFITAWSALPRWDPALPFVPWLNGIARNLVLRHRERQAREHRGRGAALAAWLTQRLAGAEREESSQVERLRECLQRLPQHLRDLLHLRYAEGIEAQALAERSGRDGAAVRMALMRARRLLSECMMPNGRTPT